MNDNQASTSRLILNLMLNRRGAKELGSTKVSNLATVVISHQDIQTLYVSKQETMRRDA